MKWLFQLILTFQFLQILFVEIGDFNELHLSNLLFSMIIFKEKRTTTIGLQLLFMLQLLNFKQKQFVKAHTPAHTNTHMEARLA